MGVPSENLAFGLISKATQDLSCGTSTFSAINPYSVNGSSKDEVINVSKIKLFPGALFPLITKGLKVSKEPKDA